MNALMVDLLQVAVERFIDALTDEDLLKQVIAQAKEYPHSAVSEILLSAFEEYGFNDLTLLIENSSSNKQ